MSKFPFIPQKLPPQIEWTKLIKRIGNAHAAIARYDGVLQNLISPEILLSPLVTNEAVLSSRIEGTQASLEDVFELEAGVKKEKSDSIKQDIQEIINYRKALLSAEEELSKRSLSLNFIKQIHKVLLESVRGRRKNPGEFRNEQNWIGLPGTPMEMARYVPPSPLLVQEFLDDWEKFLYDESFQDDLVKLSILHAQFEIIHPFRDGNGRIGRLLIPLFLFTKKVLSRPMFYMSEFLEAHRKDYYDKLLAITENNDWQGWIEFFLDAIVSQSELNLKKAKSILDLYVKLKPEFLESTKSQYSIPVLDAFFQKPIVDSPTIFQLAKINNRVTGNTILRKLEKKKLIRIKEKGWGRRPNVYFLPDLINIIIGEKLF